MNLFAFDPELEQQLNNIDELTWEACGNDLFFGLNQSEGFSVAFTKWESPAAVYFQLLGRYR